MKTGFFQQFKTLFRKHLLNHVRNRNFIKQIIGLLVVCGLCIALKKGGGNGLSYIPTYMPLAIMLFVRGVIMTWVGEKQHKHKQIQTIMGASFSAYFFSWILFFLANGILLSIIFIAIITGAGVFEGQPSNLVLQMLGLYFLLMFATFSFCLMISSFFSDSQLAGQVITFMQLLGVGLYYLLKIQSFRNSSIGLGIVALVPSVCFQFTALIINNTMNTYGSIPFALNQGYIMLACEAIGYFILFIYLQMVLPNQNGTNRHPLFFIKYFFSSKKSISEIQESFQLAGLTSARFFEEENTKKQIACSIKNLHKSFGNKKVVNGLGLNLYKKQIFCLLGHNGAGKSTTINILTGMLKPDQGDINICGYNYRTQMKEIRQKLGVCLQIDVLYDKMTVKEHLEFFGNLKGYFGEQLQTKVNQIIQKCCLITQIYKQASTLSGGNKRKLCLACAAIGDSEVIFLDQPSSGMDPNTRRTIWGMIQQLKEEGRTIVLTTHHLQEAEALSNRIGILAEGELMILGSCLYIKQKFGVGYNLTVSLQNLSLNEVQRTKQQIRSEIQKRIGSFKEDEQIAKNQIKFLLPTAQQKHFAEFFQFLESKKIQFSLTMSSLEDIFIRIGLDPNSILQNQPLPEIQKIQLPKYEPHYNFLTQFYGTFIRKALTILRSFSVFVSLILPTMYMIIGAIVAMVTERNTKNQTDQIVIVWVKFYLLVYFMTFAYSFNTSSFCGNIVAERQKKFKYLSFVMGMRKIPYWLGTLCFDLILFWIPTAIVFIVIALFPADKSQVFVNKFGYFFLLFAAFSLAFLPFTYLWTHAFDKSQTATRFFPFMVLIVFAALPQIPIYIIPQNKALPYILPFVSPLLGLVNGMLSEQILGSQLYDYVIENNITIYLTPTIWYSIGILLGQGIIFMTITIVLDNMKFKLQDRQNLSQDQMKSQKYQDLVNEQKRIHSLNYQNYPPVVVDRLYKKFPNGTVAIKDNSFVVQAGQTFGLLGPNGAGKSTTFNILTAAESKTHGTVKLFNTQVNRSVMQIFSQVGVCPQFNPIYQNLTVEEHLIFFARLKGVTGQKMNEIIDFYIKNMQLEQYRNQRSGTLSGGNKRKLCVCVSLIGNPKLLFLDEPSAGVDPISRRYLWNILASSAQQQNRSIILTTHSIHEAESLCKRIGILIKGQFYCIGSPNQLKNRYGKGYRINVRCQNLEKLQIVKNQMKKHYNDYSLQEFDSECKASFQIPKTNFKFSKAFKLFYNQLYQNQIVKEYEIAQNSLQQVFIYLSKQQPEAEPENIKKSWRFCCWQKDENGCGCLF